MAAPTTRREIIRTTSAAALAGGLLAGAQAGFAQASDELSVDVAECVELESELERFACYERRVRDAQAEAARDEQGTAAGEGASAPREAERDRDAAPSVSEPEAAPSASERDAAPSVSERDAAPAASERDAAPAASEPAEAARVVRSEEVRTQPAPGGESDDGFELSFGNPSEEGEEFFGTIAAVRERLPNQYVITLENGQVWMQTVPRRYLLRPGQRARIYSTRWGTSYRLAVEELGGFIRVELVR